MAVGGSNAVGPPSIAPLIPGVGFGILIPVTLVAAWAFDEDLFAEIVEGTFQWREKTPEEEAVALARRKRIMRESHVPWIVSDLGVLLQAYDDVQDVFAFARWNKRLLLNSELKRCIRRCIKGGYRKPLDCFMRCSCPYGPGGKRWMRDAMRGWDRPSGLMEGWFDRILGLKGPFMYALLAGQVSHSLFGVGIRLGPIMGAAMELAFRGLDAVGLPFGPEHNKFNQLKRARVLQQADKIFGSLSELPPGERARALIALREAYSGARRQTETIWTPDQTKPISDGVSRALKKLGRGDVPYFTSKDGFIDDAYGVMKQAYEMGASMPGNTLSYLAGDVMGDIANEFGATARGEDVVPAGDLSHLQKAMSRFQHARQCPGGHCPGVTEEGLYVQEWAEGRKGRGHDPAKFPPLANALAGDSFSAGALPGL
jgi:hypothetical protein